MLLHFVHLMVDELDMLLHFPHLAINKINMLLHFHHLTVGKFDMLLHLAHLLIGKFDMLLHLPDKGFFFGEASVQGGYFCHPFRCLLIELANLFILRSQTIARFDNQIAQFVIFSAQLP